MKSSHPVETAEFSKARNIDYEPAFELLAPYTFQKRDIMISNIKSRICKTNRNFSVKIRSSIEQGKELDSKNGNIMWMEASTKDMVNVGVTLKVIPDGRSATPTWRKVNGHLI